MPDEILYTWIAVEKCCDLCDGGTKPPKWGCWRCHGKGVYLVLRLVRVDTEGDNA
jgi:DnaJ-class molecular chaperone